MNKTVKTFTASFSLGLQKGYSDKLYTKSEVITALQDYQNRLIKDKELYLSCKITPCEIVLSGQVEPHLTFDFINYPRFPLEESVFKKEVELLVYELMKRFQQNRLVIVYHNETKMIEKSEAIDPRI